MTDLRSTALRERHEALGASFTDFGGWAMPVRYTSDLAEHHAVRAAAGLFDISHMAEFFVEGADAGAYLDYALAGRLSTVPRGKAKYSLLLAESGGIIDDVIVYHLDEGSFLIISNAGNRDAVANALRERRDDFLADRSLSLTNRSLSLTNRSLSLSKGPADGSLSLTNRSLSFTNRSLSLTNRSLSLSKGVTVEDVTDAYALIAVQGPVARRIVETTEGIGALEKPLADVPYYAAVRGEFHGADVLIARTGYTGEDGFELLVPNASAVALWDALLAAGGPLGLVPAGLAARDTLRLEAGMPLYGHELSLDIVPAQAGLGRVVAADKDDFVGRAALAAVVAPDAPVLVGLVAEGRRAGRAGYAVLDAGGEPVGEITSGALSPTLGHPVAMAFVSPRVAAAGTALFIDVRGTRIPATVTDLPFYRRTK